VNKIEIINW